MNRHPFFLALALICWLCLMAASILLPPLRPPLPALLCGGVMFLAVLWRCRGRALPWAVRLLLPAAALLPAAFFLLAAAFMGPISAIMFHGLINVLVALPLDAYFHQEEAAAPGNGEGEQP